MLTEQEKESITKLNRDVEYSFSMDDGAIITIETEVFGHWKRANYNVRKPLNDIVTSTICSVRVSTIQEVEHLYKESRKEQ